MSAKQPDRRRFMKDGAALAGVALGALQCANGQTPVSEAHSEERIKDLIAYGERSRFVTSVRTSVMDERHSPDQFGLTYHVRTPLQDSVGIITPSSLHYVATHRGSYVPDIDPMEHHLMIHGMVDRPLTFTLEELKRLPYVSRVHYIECNGNKAKPTHNTVQETHGMTSCSEWSGVPLSLLLKEVGVQNGAAWIVAEGAEEVKGAGSIPLAKAMHDCIVCYGQNGEPLRPQQGFPLRLVVPGFEGKNHTKWLRRIKVVDQFYDTYNEYTQHISRDPKVVSMNYEQGPKSVITFPSGGQQLPRPGFYEITGLAWSGSGAIRRVEVSTDGGKTWKDAKITEPVHRIAHTRFGIDWIWDGTDSVLQSRCTDELGQVQPTLAEFCKFWNVSQDYFLADILPSFAKHDNIIQPWKIAREGSVRNAIS